MERLFNTLQEGGQSLSYREFAALFMAPPPGSRVPWEDAAAALLSALGARSSRGSAGGVERAKRKQRAAAPKKRRASRVVAGAPAGEAQEPGAGQQAESAGTGAGAVADEKVALPEPDSDDAGSSESLTVSEEDSHEGVASCSEEGGESDVDDDAPDLPAHAGRGNEQ